MSDDPDVTQRVQTLEHRQNDIERRFTEAFPGGDHMGHARYHEIMIESLEEKKRLRHAIMEKTVAGLVWAGIVALGVAVWQYIRSALKIP